jgi:hypothetical protein
MKILATILALIIIPAALVTVFLLAMRKRYDAAVDRMWSALAKKRNAEETFFPQLVEGLPAVARSYFLHALQPGTPLPVGVELIMSGTFRASEKAEWVPFRARQILCGPAGFVWKATLKVAGPLAISGADYFFEGEGRVRFFLLGLIPIVNGSGDTVSRSAAGRALIESIWLPSMLLPSRGAVWEGVDWRRGKVTLSAGSVSSSITLTLGEDGGILSGVIPRYRGDGGGLTGPVPFGVTVENEKTFGGITIPAGIRAGWEFGNDRYFEFIRAEVEGAKFF